MTPPLQRITALIARGNAELAGQQAVKKTAGKQIDGNARVSITLKPNPAGGPPLVTMKDAPADLLNQTQETDVQEAYDAPRRRVEEKLRQFGFAPKTADVQPTDVDSWSERYRSRRELGGGVFSSALLAAQPLTDNRLRENLKNTRAASNSATLQKFVQPIEDQELQAEGTVLEAGRLAASQASEERQRAALYLSTRNQLLDQKNVLQHGNEDEYMAAVTQGLEPAGGIAPGDEDLFRRAFRSTRVSFLGDRIKALSGPEGKAAIMSYGNSPDEIERFVDEQAGAVNLTDFERQRFRRTAKGLLEYKAKEESKVVAAEAAEARKMALEARRVAAEERAVEEAARKNRNEERGVAREAKKNYDSRVQSAMDRIQNAADQMDKNSLAFAKTENPDERAELQRQNRKLAAAIEQYREQLNDALGIISQEEYDALIADGETPESIANAGKRLRKKKK